MIKYIDTNKIEIPEGFFNDLNVPKLFQWLNNLPTADVIEVVRCKNCIRWEPDGGYGLDLDGKKLLYGTCSITKWPCKEDHFCGCGVGKDGNKN